MRVKHAESLIIDIICEFCANEYKQEVINMDQVMVPYNWFLVYHSFSNKKIISSDFCSIECMNKMDFNYA